MERPGARQLLLGLWVACSALSGIRGDFCDVNLCQNGGTCLKSLDESPFFCLCAEGFTGPTCNETEKGPCHPNPCKNKGECRLLPNRGDAFNEYLCICHPGYSGKHCQYNVNECLSQPCKNGGTCLNLKGHFDCKCPSPYVGKTCQMRCKDELGMQTRAIADAQLTASSIYYGLMGMQRWAPELARLHNSGFVNAWRASNEDKKPWIQINLLKKMFLSGVVTQGAGRLGASEFVRTYKVSYSLDGRVFEFYKDENENHEKIFSGNTDKYTAVTNMFNSPVIAQYFRIHPVTYEGGYTLRFELIGCEMNGCSDPLGVKSHHISDRQITASSVYKTWGLSSMTWHPYYARLDNTGKSNAWTALRNKPGEWLQIDLLKVKKVSGIITQGARDFGHIQYVAAYKVAYSNDGKSWTVYHDDNSNSIKLFQGNHDNNSHKKNMFDVPFHARFVRILPEAWHNRITLRVELLGCDE
ncbi:lactadherin isoform X2 [Crotalus tigris]|uniref:lactadherin isoform X2 n=1 Tax=Crotalus tigris TaxID=88082 RepID=UPI00192F636A|nr:lactadherin isoform X2 [Crotalus tigris]